MLPEPSIDTLFARYMDGTATPGEERELADWALAPGNSPRIRELEEAYWQTHTGSHALSPELIERLMRSTQPATIRRMGWKRVAVAASILLALGLGYLIISNRSTSVSGGQPVAERRDVPAPDRNRASITLADGRIIYLDSLDAGTIATEHAVTVTKDAKGNILYSSAGGTANSQPVYNTLSNPRGSRVIDMQLSDGSHVWLNAGSSITFPVAFTGNERKVTMTGEGYFEITHDKTKPFIVSANNKADVTVLGTHFNVNAYDDEGAIKVTLLEGSVKVNSPAAAAMLKPGQQAVVMPDSKPEIRTAVDLEQVMAWRNGLFHFNRASISEVMKALSRWYDVEVVYQGAISQETFSGIVNRGSNLSQVLRILETAGIRYQIQGHQLIIE